MRNRSFYLIGVVALSLLAVTLLAIGCAGQTDPPASGDWTVSDNTLVEDRTVHLHGNLLVTSTGSLTLENVTLRIHLDSTGQRGKKPAAKEMPIPRTASRDISLAAVSVF